MRHLFTTAIIALALGSRLTAAPLVDGTRDALYGLPKAIQSVQSGFGDNQNELDAAYGRIDGGTLYLMLTGNLQNNFNKLDIFIDSVSGGQNKILDDTNHGGPNPVNDGWASGSGSPSPHIGMAGLTFDAGFAPDYLLFFRHGLSKLDFDYSVMGGGTDAYSFYENVFGGTEEGANTSVAGAPTAGTNFGQTFGVAFDNSNSAGVAGDGSNAGDPLAAAAVSTGLELAIPLGALGNPSGPIKVLAFINGDRHTYASNQFLPGLVAPQGNLGSDGIGNFNGSLAGLNLGSFASNPGDAPWFTIVPEPSTAILAGLAMLVTGAFAAANRRTRWSANRADY
jgi:hypothetical protein